MELKSYIVIKQVDKKHQLKDDFVVVGQDKKSIKIHDPYGGASGLQRIPEQKSGAEFSFRVDKVLEGGSHKSPTQIFRDSCDEIVNNVINNMKNGMIISYGQSKSGKSTNFFGNYKSMQIGLLQNTVNRFFELQTPQSNLSKQTGAQALYLSIFDINLETVRDFGTYFFHSAQAAAAHHNAREFNFSNVTHSSLEKQSPELLDNSNEAIQVRGLSKIEIKSGDQFSKLMIDEEEFRTQLDTRHKINNKRYHQIYVLHLKHRMSAQMSYLYFVKIAGSEKILKGQQVEQQRIQEQIIANNTLFALSKYLGGLTKKDNNASYHESKLTKALHGVLQNDEKECQVVFLGHIYPVEQNYEETLLTLQYMDRLKGLDQAYQKVIFDGPMPEQVQAQERLMERILDENADLKRKYEQQVQEEKDKFDEIKRRLGLEYTVNQLLRAKANTKEHSYLILHQEADDRSQTLSKINQDLNKKLKNMSKKQEESEYQLKFFQQKCEDQISLLESKYDDLLKKHNETRYKIKSKVREEMKDINEEISKMIHHGQILIEEKAHLIHGLKEELKKNSEHHNKISEMKDMGKREAELMYKQQLNDKQIDYKKTMKNINEQYDHLIRTKDEELQKFLSDATKYTVEKKDEMKEARNECVQLFEIIKKQINTIELVESGALSNGIKSYNIPKHEKQIYPERDHFQFLEKTRTLISASNSVVYQQYSKQKTLMNEMNQSKFEDTYIKEMEENLKIQKKGQKVTIQKQAYNTYHQNEEEKTNFEPFRKTRLQDVDYLTLDQLKKFAKALQVEIKRCNNTEPLNPQGIRDSTLENVLKEREKWKQMAVNENKKLADSQEVLDSQKRLIEKQNSNKKSFYSQSNNPGTATANVANNNLNNGSNNLMRSSNGMSAGSMKIGSNFGSRPSTTSNLLNRKSGSNTLAKAQ
ncbi:UNKNOWN [Stylonychia lemnae]|uniref:Kinesin motor domain-containing protein n=1 Tax=Stylonychia lemnae TaxID=5949 RepID=A0A078B8P1_STYLE|nr:UNKNOWN [Stylonychia lemnae]|eukprot:CDW90581.1 UNKNOWN [Stylonychia lemnae]